MVAIFISIWHNRLIMDLNNVTGRCMGCQENDKLMKDVEVVINKRGTRAAKGKCAKCNTGMYKFLPKEA